MTWWYTLTPTTFWGFISVLVVQVVESEEIAKKAGLSAPHTSHCLGNGQIMISAMGDPDGKAKGILTVIIVSSQNVTHDVKNNLGRTEYVEKYILLGLMVIGCFSDS